MKVCVLILLFFALTTYAYRPVRPKCPGKCLTVRCGAIPVCNKNEIFIEADYDCICCPYCKAVCDPEICDRVDCVAPEDVEKRCIEEGLIYVKPDRKTCNCCGDCVKK